MPLVHRVSPVLDGVAVSLGASAPRHIRIPSAEYATPLWLRTEAGLVVRVNELPYQGVIPVGDLEVLSADPASGGGGGVEPLAEDDFSTYADTDALHTEAYSSDRWTSGVQRQISKVVLETGFGVPALGTTQCMRYDFSDSEGKDAEISLGGLNLPGDPTEIWYEVWEMYSEDFTTDGPQSGNHDYKMDQVHATADTSGNRWVMNGSPPANIRCGDPSGGNMHVDFAVSDTGEDAVSETDNPGSGLYWDGKWFRRRVHIKLESSFGAGDGIVEAWIHRPNEYDVNQPIKSDVEFGADHGAWNWIRIGANMNKGTSRAMQRWIGYVGAWDTDPGW